MTALNLRAKLATKSDKTFSFFHLYLFSHLLLCPQFSSIRSNTHTHNNNHRKHRNRGSFRSILGSVPCMLRYCCTEPPFFFLENWAQHRRLSRPATRDGVNCPLLLYTFLYTTTLPYGIYTYIYLLILK